MKTICILIGLLSLYADVRFLGHPIGMNRALNGIMSAVVYHNQGSY